MQATFDVGEGLHGFNYTGCAVLLSLGVLWSGPASASCYRAEKMQAERAAQSATAATCVGLLMRVPSAIQA